MKDTFKMTNEEISKDVQDAADTCWQTIVDMISQHSKQVQWKLAARVVNSLWSSVYRPTFTAIALGNSEHEGKK